MVDRRVFVGSLLASFPAVALARAAAGQDHVHSGGDPVLQQFARELAVVYTSAKRAPMPSGEHLRRYAGALRLLNTYLAQADVMKQFNARLASADRDTLLTATVDRNRVLGELRALGMDVADFEPGSRITVEVRARVVQETMVLGPMPLLARHLAAVERAAAAAERHGAAHPAGVVIAPVENDDCWSSWQALIGEMEALTTLICLDPLLVDLCAALWGSIAMDYMMMFFVCGFGWF